MLSRLATLHYLIQQTAVCKITHSFFLFSSLNHSTAYSSNSKSYFNSNISPRRSFSRICHVAPWFLVLGQVCLLLPTPNRQYLDWFSRYCGAESCDSHATSRHAYVSQWSAYYCQVPSIDEQRFFLIFKTRRDG